MTVSKSFDNAASCSSENGVIVHDAVYEGFVSALVKRGTYLCCAAEKEQLQSYLWKLNTKGYVTLNPEIVAKSATDIAAGAGFSVPDDTLILAVEAAPPVSDEPFADEKLSPVLAIWQYGEFEEGLKPLKSNFGRALLIACAWGTIIGGIGTPSGAGPNPLAIGFVKEMTGYQITFGQWMLFGVPAALLMVPASWAVLLIFFKPVMSHLVKSKK